MIGSSIFGFVQWVLMGCGVGFGSISVGVWLVVGCGVARGGGSHFWSISVVLGVGFFCCFVLHCSKT